MMEIWCSKNEEVRILIGVGCAFYYWAIWESLLGILYWFIVKMILSLNGTMAGWDCNWFCFHTLNATYLLSNLYLDILPSPVL